MEFVRAQGKSIKPEQKRRGAQTEQQPRLRRLLRSSANIGQQAGKSERAKTPTAQKGDRVTKCSVHAEHLLVAPSRSLRLTQVLLWIGPRLGIATGAIFFMSQMCILL
jgi:hypothetical protein